MGQQRNFIARDTAIYMAAKVIEGIVGVIAVVVYTYLFIAQQYGRYNIVNLTIVTSAMVVVGWLSQAIMRYINEYKNKAEVDEFYSTTFFIWLKIVSVAVIVASVGILAYSWIFKPDFISLLWASLIMFITYGTALICTNILVARREVCLNLILSVGGVLAKLIVSILLMKVFGIKIIWVLVSNIIFDAIAVVVVVSKLNILSHIKYRSCSKVLSNKFFLYGLPLVGLTFSTALLHNSDRYIIQILVNSSAVGIYYANYSLMSAGFSMLANAVMKGSYPSILKAWSDGEKPKTLELISCSVRYYLIIAIPALVGVVVLAQSIANIILAPEYVEGYVVMKWVALGMVLLGLTEYTNKYWELSENTNVIFKNSMISGIFNIILNIILIPIFDYKISAVTTALGFLLYFSLSYFGSRKQFKWTLTSSNYINIISSAIVMGLILKLIVTTIKPTLIGIIVLVILGGSIYGVLLCITGELKNEINSLKKLVNKNS
jgi:O-antigen/teichoic acid export membrane protein